MSCEKSTRENLSVLTSVSRSSVVGGGMIDAKDYHQEGGSRIEEISYCTKVKV